MHSRFTRCGFCYLFVSCVMLLPTHLLYVGFGNFTFIGMDIKSIVKREVNTKTSIIQMAKYRIVSCRMRLYKWRMRKESSLTF